MARKVEHLHFHLNQILKTMFVGGWVAVKAIFRDCLQQSKSSFVYYSP